MARTAQTITQSWTLVKLGKITSPRKALYPCKLISAKQLILVTISHFSETCQFFWYFKRFRGRSRIFQGGAGGGGGGRGEVAGTLGLQNQWGMLPKCCNLRTGLNLKLLTRHNSNTTNEKLLWGTCPECLPLFLPSNFFQFFSLLQKGGGYPPNPAFPPPPNPKSAPDGSSIRESNQAKNKLFQTKRNYSFQTQNRLMRYVQIFVKIHNAILRDISILIYSNSI